MSDLQCALTVILLRAETPRSADLQAALRAERVAVVAAHAGSATPAAGWAEVMEVPRRELTPGTVLLVGLAELADEFRGETALALVTGTDLARLGVAAGQGARLLLDADDARIQPWPVPAG